MSTYRALVIGGYGFFGSRLVALLSRQPGLHIFVAGRSRVQAQALADKLACGASAQLAAQAIDIASPALVQTLSALKPDVVVHTAGPFEGQDYGVAAACIAAQAHYIDLADGRDFVAGIVALDDAAAGAGAMHVRVTGTGTDGAARTRTWSLVATQGDGPFVPTLAAAALVRRLAAGETYRPGARPCLGLLSLQDFEREAAGLSIAMKDEP